MNKSNAGANTNTAQMLLDALILVCAFGIAYCIQGYKIDEHTTLTMVALVAVFILIYLLSNKEEYLYNVTMFYYLDRVQRKITKSFLVSTVATAALMGVIAPGENARKFYLIFLIVAYVLASLKMFFFKPLSKLIAAGNAPRTAFVGKRGQFNKFRYFLDKTSIRVNPIGYIAMRREDLEGAEEEYLGCLEDLEQLVREHSLDQVYIIQKHKVNEKFDRHTYLKAAHQGSVPGYTELYNAFYQEFVVPLQSN